MLAQCRAAIDIDYYFEKGIKQQSLIDIQVWTLNFSWSDKKRKDKELTWAPHPPPNFVFTGDVIKLSSQNSEVLRFLIYTKLN